MITEMHDAKVHSARLVGSHKVVFTFDLSDSKNEMLRDQEVVKRSMACYMLAHPNVKKWSVIYIDAWVVLTVFGNITNS